MKSQPSKRARKDKKQGKEASNNPTLVKWNEMNRKQRREMMRKVQSEDLSLQVVHPHAAGIDIGNESHYVAVPPSRDPQPVRCFGCTTAELKKMVEGLRERGDGSGAGECTRDEESAGAEDGCAGRPVVDEAAHLRLIAEFISPVAGDSYPADVLAAAPRSGAEYRSPHSAHAKGADADEYPVGQRDQRHQRGDRADHPEGASGWGTRSPGTGGVSGLPGGGQRGRDGAGSGGQLARGAAVCLAAGTGGIRVLPETDHGVRSAAGTVPRATRGSDPGSHSAGRDAKGTAQEEERQSTV